MRWAWSIDSTLLFGLQTDVQGSKQMRGNMSGNLAKQRGKSFAKSESCVSNIYIEIIVGEETPNC